MRGSLAAWTPDEVGHTSESHASLIYFARFWKEKGRFGKPLAISRMDINADVVVGQSWMTWPPLWFLVLFAGMCVLGSLVSVLSQYYRSLIVRFRDNLS